MKGGGPDVLFSACTWPRDCGKSCGFWKCLTATKRLRTSWNFGGLAVETAAATWRKLLPQAWERASPAPRVSSTRDMQKYLLRIPLGFDAQFLRAFFRCQKLVLVRACWEIHSRIQPCRLSSLGGQRLSAGAEGGVRASAALSPGQKWIRADFVSSSRFCLSSVSGRVPSRPLFSTLSSVSPESFPLCNSMTRPPLVFSSPDSSTTIF